MFKKTAKPALFAIIYSMAFQCHATSTLDCMGSPYSVMIHVGSTESGEDFLADIMLHKEGNSEFVAIYSNDELEIASFKWTEMAAGNMINVSTKAKQKLLLSLKASQLHGTIKVNNEEFPIKCYWGLP